MIKKKKKKNVLSVIQTIMISVFLFASNNQHNLHYVITY